MINLQVPLPLVSIEWLQENTDHPSLIMFDASWHMPASGRNGKSEWKTECIKNARFFDFDQSICAHNKDLPHMMPDEVTSLNHCKHWV